MPGANISAVARRIGILPSQLFRWRRELSGDGEQSSALVKEQQPRSAAIKERVVEVVIGDAVVRAGADVDEAHLQRVMRGGAVGLIPSGATGLPLHDGLDLFADFNRRFVSGKRTPSGGGGPLAAYCEFPILKNDRR
ncbi:transposase [Ensifer sesbaniae]|uniref:transposase n=1 Tax=Ensifer sesbaniae TaxID=1214071 RepID=UPI001569B767